jgi:hypothetical protein
MHLFHPGAIAAPDPFFRKALIKMVARMNCCAHLKDNVFV